MRTLLLTFLRCAIAATAAFLAIPIVAADLVRAAQSDRAQLVSSVVNASFAQGLLWRVEKPGTAPSVVFGTVHLADKRVTALPAIVRQQLDAARTFTMEVSFDAASIAALAAKMVYSDGRNLESVAGPDLFGKASALLAAKGVPPEVARLFRPWAAMLMLVMPPQQPDAILDVVLRRIAADQGKRLYYLESMEAQIAAFEGVAEADQVELLRHAVATQHEAGTARSRMIEAYLRRDLAGLWALGEERVAKYPGTRELNEMMTRRLLNDRNARMTERMQPQLDLGLAFIAVGALHLYGEEGVLGRLQRSGYRVTRLY